ncbi:hypothetical protein WOLCODRAFT_151142 [Wolfiporia cocos MD-104 SS10]|uniref:Uncharacterized protein n=1 Tax=Wolfiporia cocos (strain MD-104) TaxID=742152 RepID=A0A2H3JFY2_WOLCO|nr:hypothetical protein WOLCODRAFT_151142 [Wolfiporia cocos MD-104 SS10]
MTRPLFESLPKLAYPTPGPPHYNERGELLPPISMHLTPRVPLGSNSNQSGPSLTPLTRSLTRQPMFAFPHPAVRSTKPATQSPLIETPASTATSAPTPPIALPNFNAYQPELGSSSTPDLTQRHIRVCRMYGCSTILSPNHLWTSQRTKRTRLSLGDESIMRDPVNGQAQNSPASLKSATMGRGEDQDRSDENATPSQHYKRLQMPLNTSSAEIIADCPSSPELPLIVHSLEHSDANPSSTSMNSSARSHVTQRPGLAQFRELNRTGSDSPVSSDAYARSRSFIGTETHSGPSQQNECSSVAETPHSVADAKGTVESPAILQSAQTSSEGQTSAKELTTNGMAILNRGIPGSQTVVADVLPPTLKCDAAGLLNEADGSLVPNSSDPDGDGSQDDDADMQSSTKSPLQRSPCIELSPLQSPTSRSPIGPSREVDLKSNTASDVALSDLTPLEASEGESEVDSSESESESDDEPLATKLRRNALSNNTRPTHSRRRSTATGRTFTQRFLGFLNAQAHYLRYKYDQGAVVDAAKPTLFTFGGEYSVVADPTGGVVDTMAKDIAAHVQSVLGVKFK